MKDIFGSDDLASKLAKQMLEHDKAVAKVANPVIPNIPDMADIGAQIAEKNNRMAGRYAAKEIFEYLSERLVEFQDNLQDDEELGLKLANFGVAAEIHVREIRFKNPSIIEFGGVDAVGNEVSLVQHVSQLNFLFVAVKAIDEENPCRIGFIQ